MIWRIINVYSVEGVEYTKEDIKWKKEFLAKVNLKGNKELEEILKLIEDEGGWVDHMQQLVHEDMPFDNELFRKMMKAITDFFWTHRKKDDLIPKQFIPVIEHLSATIYYPFDGPLEFEAAREIADVFLSDFYYGDISRSYIATHVGDTNFYYRFEDGDLGEFMEYVKNAPALWATHEEGIKTRRKEAAKENELGTCDEIKWIIRQDGI